MSEIICLKNLFTLELANNHQGDVSHGLRIIKELGTLARKKSIRAAIKFQFRDLTTFIHPFHQKDSSAKHISRFSETHLSRESLRTLHNEVKQQGLISMCTPFDEASVDHCLELGIDILKVASCSATDLPLLQKISNAAKPIVASTGGLNEEQLDRLVAILSLSKQPLALMHCVAIYPTPREKLQLHRIDFLRTRYPEITIGFSTHESPDELSSIQIAYAKGARIFEKHVGIATEQWPLNAYSASPEQLSRWIESYRIAVAECGRPGSSPSLEEAAPLRELMRGAFARRKISAGEIINREDVFFAMPIFSDNQLSSGEWQPDMQADRNYEKNEPLQQDLKLTWAVPCIKSLLKEAGIRLSENIVAEFSHHHGKENFSQWGAVFLHNPQHAELEKIVLLLGGQCHPAHLHREREEIYSLLYGDLEVLINGRVVYLKPGENVTVPKGALHSFKSQNGAIFEERLSSHSANDSCYSDERISQVSRHIRKTICTHFFAEAQSVEEVFHPTSTAAPGKLLHSLQEPG